MASILDFIRLPEDKPTLSIGVFESYNATSEELRGAEDTVLGSIGHVFKMAFYDTFGPFVDDGRVHNIGANLRKIESSLIKPDAPKDKVDSYKKERGYLRVLLGVRSKDYESGVFLGVLSNLSRFAGNVVRLFTEFPVTLVDYFVEKAFAHLLEDVINPLLDKHSKFSVGARAAGVLLVAPVFVAVGVAHAAMKITSTAVRLMTSHEKMWAEADAIGPWMGRAARVATVGLIIAACVFCPLVPAKFAPYIVPYLTKGILSFGNSIGGAVGLATSGVAAAAITGAIFSTFVVTSKKIAKAAASYLKPTKEKDYDKIIRESEMNFRVSLDSTASMERELGVSHKNAASLSVDAADCEKETRDSKRKPLEDAWNKQEERQSLILMTPRSSEMNDEKKEDGIDIWPSFSSRV